MSRVFCLGLLALLLSASAAEEYGMLEEAGVGMEIETKNPLVIASKYDADAKFKFFELVDATAAKVLNHGTPIIAASKKKVGPYQDIPLFSVTLDDCMAQMTGFSSQEAPQVPQSKHGCVLELQTGPVWKSQKWQTKVARALELFYVSLFEELRKQTEGLPSMLGPRFTLKLPAASKAVSLTAAIKTFNSKVKKTEATSTDLSSFALEPLGHTIKDVDWYFVFATSTTNRDYETKSHVQGFAARPFSTSAQVNMGLKLQSFGATDNDALLEHWPLTDVKGQEQGYAKKFYAHWRKATGMQALLDSIPLLQATKDDAEVRGFFIALGLFVHIRTMLDGFGVGASGTQVKTPMGLLIKNDLKDIMRGIKDKASRGHLHKWWSSGPTAIAALDPLCSAPVSAHLNVPKCIAKLHTIATAVFTLDTTGRYRATDPSKTEAVQHEYGFMYNVNPKSDPKIARVPGDTDRTLTDHPVKMFLVSPELEAADARSAMVVEVRAGPMADALQWAAPKANWWDGKKPAVISEEMKATLQNLSPSAYIDRVNAIPDVVVRDGTRTFTNKDMLRPVEEVMADTVRVFKWVAEVNGENAAEQKPKEQPVKPVSDLSRHLHHLKLLAPKTGPKVLAPKTGPKVDEVD